MTCICLRFTSEQTVSSQTDAQEETQGSSTYLSMPKIRHKHRRCNQDPSQRQHRWARLCFPPKCRQATAQHFSWNTDLPSSSLSLKASPLPPKAWQWSAHSGEHTFLELRCQFSPPSWTTSSLKNPIRTCITTPNTWSSLWHRNNCKQATA